MSTGGANAITRIVNMGYSPDFAELVVDTVLEEITDPAPEMLAAGLDELNLALGKPKPHDKLGGNPYRRDLLRTIWHAMIDRAR